MGYNPFTTKARTSSQGQGQAYSSWQHHGDQAEEPVPKTSPYSSHMQARNTRQDPEDPKNGGRFVFSA